MNPPPKRYSRLPGRRIGIVQRASLWLGADHVLVVHETMTGESYRRFFFRDIQSIVIRATTRRQTTTIVLLLLAFLNLLPLVVLAGPDADTSPVPWLACGTVVWVALAVVNLLRGPTCETRIRTAVQDDVVPPLGRLDTARRVVEQLRPRILAAQAAAVEPAATPDGGAAP